MSTNTADSDPSQGSREVSRQPVLLVDFAVQVGLKEVSLSPQDLAARSSAALDGAMASIRQMAERVTSATKGLAQPPDEVEVEFGLKLDAAGGTLIARAGVEAHLTVTLKWSNADK